MQFWRLGELPPWPKSARDRFWSALHNADLSTRHAVACCVDRALNASPTLHERLQAWACAADILGVNDAVPASRAGTAIRAITARRP